MATAKNTECKRAHPEARDTAQHSTWRVFAMPSSSRSDENTRGDMTIPLFCKIKTYDRIGYDIDMHTLSGLDLIRVDRKNRTRCGLHNAFRHTSEHGLFQSFPAVSTYED